MNDYNEEIWKSLTTPIEIPVMIGETFSSVNATFHKWLNEGKCIRCPISGTVHNVPYKRRISKGMARALKLLYQIQVSRQYDGNSPNTQADFTKLRYWGLIAKDKGSSVWKITDQGIKFVRGEIGLPVYAVVANNEFIAHLGQDTGIREILRS